MGIRRRAFIAFLLMTPVFFILLFACNENDEDADRPPTGDDDDDASDDDTCVDADNDHWCVPDDCQDNNAFANPGRIEDCDDGIDNDCNGFTDAEDPPCAVPETTDVSDS